MGFFSWNTLDTKKSIANVHSPRRCFGVYMHDDRGNTFFEPAYDGYGVFGGKDYYELLAEMNGYTTRDEGIDIAFGHIKVADLKWPNLTQAKNWEWVNMENDRCPDQGFFYDDGMLENDYYVGPEDLEDDNWIEE